MFLTNEIPFFLYIFSFPHKKNLISAPNLSAKQKNKLSH